MPQKVKMIALASAVLSGLTFTSAIAAEREQVRAVINLIAAVKMPFPEGFERDVARTEYVRLDGRSETVACLRVDDKVNGATSISPHWDHERRCCGSAMSQWKEYR